MHAQLLVRWLFYPTRIPSFAIVVVVVNIIDNVIGIMARKSYAGYIQVDEKFDDAVEGGAVGDLPRLGFVKK